MKTYANVMLTSPKEKWYKEVYIIESLFLGNKSYVDQLEYVDDNDKEHKIHDDIARMTGFPTSCIQQYATRNKISVPDVYKKLYDNKSIKIGLTNQTTKCVFLEIPQSLMLNHYVLW